MSVIRVTPVRFSQKLYWLGLPPEDSSSHHLLPVLAQRNSFHQTMLKLIPKIQSEDDQNFKKPVQLFPEGVHSVLQRVLLHTIATELMSG